MLDCITLMRNERAMIAAPIVDTCSSSKVLKSNLTQSNIGQNTKKGCPNCSRYIPLVEIHKSDFWAGIIIGYRCCFVETRTFSKGKVSYTLMLLIRNASRHHFGAGVQIVVPDVL